ncbi:MAG: hypothetical protein JW778_02645 [Candidatus Altiarchaeota archaeon]|nr:hypothetical protein [Candidatus Altiarchaeota archaeon]
MYESKKQIPSNETLSDEGLLRYARSSFNKEEMIFEDYIIGYHNGVPVRVSFPCSDVCPQYTVRVIRYNVSLSDCISVGGEIRSIYVPVGIGAMAEEFCFPQVIVDNNIYDFAEN